MNNVKNTMKPCFCFSSILKFEDIVALKLHRKPQQLNPPKDELPETQREKKFHMGDSSSFSTSQRPNVNVEVFPHTEEKSWKGSHCGCWWVFPHHSCRVWTNVSSKAAHGPAQWTEWGHPTAVSPDTPTTWSTRIFIVSSGACEISTKLLQGVFSTTTCCVQSQTPKQQCFEACTDKQSTVIAVTHNKSKSKELCERWNSWREPWQWRPRVWCAAFEWRCAALYGRGLLWL